MIGYSLLFPIILFSGTIAFIFSFFVYRIAEKKGFIDLPNSASHKQHGRPTALGGGVVLLLSLCSGWLLFSDQIGNRIPGLLLAGGVIAGWGLLDDIFDLSPFKKLVGQLLATAVLIFVGIQAHIFSFEWANYLVTVLWVVGLVNAFNFVDSMDGLALGLAVIAAGFFMLVTVDSGQPGLARLAALILGTGAGLMFYNTHPAKLFLGDSGAQLLGLILAAIGIAYNPAGLPQEVSWFTPILVLGVPIFDATLVVFSRIRRGVPVYRAGHDHTFHRLVELGMDTNRAVYAMHLASGGLGLLAFIILDTPALWANVIFFGISTSGVFLILFLQQLSEGTQSGK